MSVKCILADRAGGSGTNIPIQTEAPADSTLKLWLDTDEPSEEFYPASEMTLQKLGAASNPNLLDNWYFVDPINQRGGYVVPPGTSYYIPEGGVAGTLEAYTKVERISLTGYPVVKVEDIEYVTQPDTYVRGYTSTTYSIDRWRTYDIDAVLLEQDGIKFVRTAVNSGYFFMQTIDNYSQFSGKTVTLSALIDETDVSLAIGLDVHTDLSGSKFVQCSGAGLFSVTIEVPEDVNMFRAVFSMWNRQPVTAKVRAMKLELGDKQTLAHQDSEGNWVLNDPPPNKQQELAKCQRYFLAIPPAYGKFAGSANATINEVAFFIPTPVEMRANPAPISTVLAFNVETGVYSNREADLVFYKSSNGLIVIATSEEQIANKVHAATNVGNYEQIYLDANL